MQNREGRGLRPAGKLPSFDLLESLFDYEPETGVLRSKITNRSAGSRTRIDGERYYRHRVIFKLVTGVEPPEDLVFRDGNEDNCRLENLHGVLPRKTWDKEAKHYLSEQEVKEEWWKLANFYRRTPPGAYKLAMLMLDRREDRLALPENPSEDDFIKQLIERTSEGLVATFRLPDGEETSRTFEFLFDALAWCREMQQSSQGESIS